MLINHSKKKNNYSPYQRHQSKFKHSSPFCQEMTKGFKRTTKHSVQQKKQTKTITYAREEHYCSMHRNNGPLTIY